MNGERRERRVNEREGLGRNEKKGEDRWKNRGRGRGEGGRDEEMIKIMRQRKERGKYKHSKRTKREEKDGVDEEANKIAKRTVT